MAEFQYLNGSNSEVQDKQAEAYLYAPSGTTGIAATGVIEGLVVRQTATASGSVLIDAGGCLNQASLGQGADRLINPSQKTLDIFTANPMGGLPRNDIVTFDSITTAIIPITGTPNATPTDPTVPATSVALGRLRHAASATTIPTAKIDDLRVLTTLRGIPATPLTLIVGYTATDYTTAVTAATVTFTAVTGRTYRISAGLIAAQQTAAGVPTVKLLVDTVEQFRLLSGTSYAAGTIMWGVSAQYMIVGDGASHTVAVTAQNTAGALRIAASGVNKLVVEQIA